jgi:cyclic lactone autoinducer peptide
MEGGGNMRKPFQIKILGFVSAFLLLVAAGGASPACWFNWYQPKLPE